MIQLVFCVLLLTCAANFQRGEGARLVDDSATTAVKIITERQSSLGKPIRAQVVFRNNGSESAEFQRYVHCDAMVYNGTVLGLVFGPMSDTVVLKPGESSCLEVEVPWTAIEPLRRYTEFFDFRAVLTRKLDDCRSMAQATVTVDSIPLVLSVSPTGRVVPGTKLKATMEFVNPLDVPLERVWIHLSGHRGLLIGGENMDERIEVGTVNPGQRVRLSREFIAIEQLGHAISARLMSVYPSLGDSSVAVSVVECAADFDEDGVVTAQDVLLYLETWANDDPEASFETPEAIDGADLLRFLEEWKGGCAGQ